MPRSRKPPPGPNDAGGYQGPGTQPGGGGGPPLGAGAPLAPGKPYGENLGLAQGLAAVPLDGAGPGPVSPSGPGPAPPGVAGGNPLAGALQAALGASPPPAGGLLRPTERPHEPLTAGLSTGDGPGPEMLDHTPNPVVDTLARVATLTGDPTLAAIADRARAMAGM